MKKLLLAAVLFAVALYGPASSVAPVIYYVSNEASHSYVVGSDSNTCLSKSVPCLTIAHATALAAATGLDSAYVNPSATPYVENSGSNYLTFGTMGTITGDPSLCGTATLPAAYPTIRATAASRVINVDSRAFAQTLACAAVDSQSSASRDAISMQTNSNFTTQQVIILNVAAGAKVVSNIGGTSVHTYDRMTVGSSNVATSPWGWGSTSSSLSVTVKGGTYGMAASFSVTSAAIGSLWFIEDVNDNLPAFTGNTSYAVSVTSATLSGSFIGALTMSGGAATVRLTGSTIPNWTIRNTVSTTPTGAQAAIQVLGMASTTGTATINSGTGLPKALMQIQSGTGGGTLTSSGNSCALATAATDACYYLAYGTAMTSTNDSCSIPTGGAGRICGEGGADGWVTASSNTGAATATLALGDASARTMIAQSWTQAAVNSTGFAPDVANFDVYVKKVGAPVDNIVFYLYSDTANSPNASVQTCSGTIPGASLSTSTVQQWHVACARPVTVPSTKYWIVAGRDGAVSGTNYFLFDTNATVTAGVDSSFDGVSTWTNDATKALRFIANTGWYHHTSTWTNFLAQWGDPADTNEKEGINSGPNYGTTIKGLRAINTGFCAVIKNTLNASLVSDILCNNQAGAYSGIYSKAAVGVVVDQNTVVVAGTATGAALTCDQDSTGVTNPVISTGFVAKNNILITNSGAYPYAVTAASCTGIGGIDYNDLYMGGTIVNSVTYDTLPIWRGRGYDVNSITTNPVLPNQSTPTTFADITPPYTSPVIGAGTDLRSVVATDALGRPFLPRPSIGAIEWSTGELSVRVTGASNVYGIIRKIPGSLVWNTSTHALEAYSAANLAYYAMGMAQMGSSQRWMGNFPLPGQGLGFGAYAVDYRVQAGGAPAESDTIISDAAARNIVDWTSTNELPPIFYRPVGNSLN